MRGVSVRRLIIALVAGGALLGPAGNAAAAAPAIPWHKCTESAQRGFQCAKIRVPLDYERPRWGEIKLALIRHRANDPGRRIGTLFYEPGGPGVPGTDFLPALAFDGFPAAVQARFDIVSWDPRGVGASTAVECFASQDAEDRFFAGSPTRNVDGFPVGQGQMTTWIDDYRRFGDRCERRNGRLLTHVSTLDTVRDLDLMRRRAGERKLNFVGTSYGTMVGAVYANVFPARVRAMALDGVVNPSGWSHAQIPRNGGRFLLRRAALQVGRRNGRTLNAFLDLCGSTDTAHCAFSAGSPDGDSTEVRRAAGAAARGADGRANDLRAARSRERSALSTWWPTGGLRRSTCRSCGSGDRRPSPRRPAATRSRRWRSPAARFHPRRPAPSRPLDAFAQQRSGVVGPFWAWDYEPCSTWPVRSAHRYTGPWNHRTATRCW